MPPGPAHGFTGTPSSTTNSGARPAIRACASTGIVGLRLPRRRYRGVRPRRQSLRQVHRRSRRRRRLRLARRAQQTSQDTRHLHRPTRATRAAPTLRSFWQPTSTRLTNRASNRRCAISSTTKQAILTTTLAHPTRSPSTKSTARVPVGVCRTVTQGGVCTTLHPSQRHGGSRSFQVHVSGSIGVDNSLRESRQGLS